MAEFLSTESLQTELQKFCTINNRHVKVLSKKSRQIRKALETTEDPLHFLKKYNNLTSKMKRERSAVSLELLELQSVHKFYNQEITRLNSCAETLREDISDCIINNKHLAFEKEKILNDHKKKHQALKNASYYYKRNVDIYIDLTEVQPLNYQLKLCYFSKIKSENYFVIFLKNEECKQWELISTTPKMGDNIFNILKQHVRDSNRIPSCVCYIHKTFLKMKQNSEKT